MWFHFYQIILGTFKWREVVVVSEKHNLFRFWMGIDEHPKLKKYVQYL